MLIRTTPLREGDDGMTNKPSVLFGWSELLLLKLLVWGLSTEELFSGLTPDTAAMVVESLGRGNSDFGLQLQKQGWLITIGALERKET